MAMILSKETQQRFTAWWKRQPTDRPIVRIIGRKPDAEEPPQAKTPEQHHLDVELKHAQQQWAAQSCVFLGESYPCMDINMGAGSLALYQGAQPHFTWETIWFEPCIGDGGWSKPLVFDENNAHWQRHLSLLRQGMALSQGAYRVSVPDLVEHLDILSAMRGPQPFCYDLVDEPEQIMARLWELEALYMRYFDTIYDIVKDEEGGNAFTAFAIWGPGKTAKVQCDHLALMSPQQTRDFLLPVLTAQCEKLDFSMFHLDGVSAIPHLKQLLTIDALDGIEWTPGSGVPDGLNPRWYPLYDEVRDAGKNLWIMVDPGNVEDMLEGSRKLTARHGGTGIYIVYPELPLADAQRLMAAAEGGFA